MTQPADDRLPPLTDGRVRTFRGRKGRLSDLSLERLDRLGPRWGLPPGRIDAARTFGRVVPLVLEIGAGHGAAAVAYASSHRGHDLVAVDVHVPGIARLLGRADAAGVTNLRVVRGDAVEVLTDQVAPAQLDAVHLFF
ncbi:MAG: tRNA (guanosine(46)-N7)-methyltransferase TrmB, partial [Lapillicoccus sp.]